jgi:hypothetical protein
MTDKHWTWEKEETPAKKEFLKKYIKAIKSSLHGDFFDVVDAYVFHKEERAYSCRFLSVVFYVIEYQGWNAVKGQIYRSVYWGELKKTNLDELYWLCGGMKHYEFFKKMRLLATIVEYPKTFREELRKERKAIKKATGIEKKRLGL